MIRLAAVIDTFEADFRAQYRHRLRAEHYRALAAIKHCRTQASPTMQVHCTQCDHHKRVPHSCGHRHCPHCQHHESQQWLERQLKKQVPAEYFLLTFTLPAQFRAQAFAHQSVVYELMLRCCWETVRTFSHNDKQLRVTPGAIAVLHTNTRRLDYHPHVHWVMPAAAVDGERRQWRTKRRSTSKGGYLFNHKAVAKVFRAKMLAAIQAAGLTLPARYPKDWVVDCKSVGSGEKALIYLGRYLYRDTPLMLPIGKSREPLTRAALHAIVKKVFDGAASRLRQRGEQYAARADQLERASAHWLRHTAGSHMADQQVDLRSIRDNLGHESLKTTSQYLHSDDDARHKETEQKHRIGW